MIRNFVASLVLVVPFACGCGDSSEPSAVATDEIATFLQENPELNSNEDPDPEAVPDDE